MVRHLAGVARDLGLKRIVAPFIPTAKNIPARQFLESLGIDKESADGVERFVLTIERAAEVVPVVQAPFGEPVEDEKAPAPRAASSDPQKSARWNRLARELTEPEQILSATARGRLRERLAGSELVPPRTETERRLVAIWKEALNIRQVGVRDDYFEIGGTSLATVMICAAIEKEFDKDLPLTVFLEFPTIEALAARIERVEETHSLVPLQQGGAGIPLFLVHDADGETLLYRNLALRFAGRRPVYAIQPQGREDARIVHTRIEQMAAHYVREIRKVRPSGPYLLGGLCAAGVLSFEMALQLEEAGEEARLVAIFDAADVEARPRARLETQRRMGRLREAMQTSSLTELPAVAARKARNYLAHALGSRLRSASDRVSVGTLRFCLDRGLPLPPWARRVSVRAVYLDAESKYRPRAATRHEIVLYRATSGQGADEPYVQLFEDPDLGWKKRSAAGVVAIDVPGGHSSMLQEPNVSAIAQALGQYLDAHEAQPDVASAAAGPLAISR
jgi:thioesterase domain-containing protein/acyl carrier protein